MPRKKERGRAANGNGTIRKKTINKNGKQYVYWEARYTAGFDPGTGKQMQRSITGKTQREVAQKLKEITLEIDRGIYQAPNNLTVADWLNIWTKDYLCGVKPRTLEAYLSSIEHHIRPELGKIKLEVLNTHTIQTFYNHLTHPVKKGQSALSPKSVKNIHSILHRALQQAVLTGCLHSNPTEATVLPRIERKELKPLDDEAISRFIAAVKGHVYEIVYLVTLFTGMRQGEILGLTWDCVDFASSTIIISRQLQYYRSGEENRREYHMVSTKNGKTRRITPAPYVMELLQKQRERQAEWRLKAGPEWDDNGLVFTNELGGHLTHNSVYRSFKQAIAKIGMPETRFHDLRHSYAVAAIRSGDDIKTIQGNLGHATASFTLDVYGHVTEQMQRASADRMEKFIKSVSGE